MNRPNNFTALALFLITLGVVFRLIPHVPNFAPIAALGLFAGIYLGKKWALLLPLVSMIVSDMFLGFDSIQMRIAVYGSILAAAGIGVLIKDSVSIKKIFMGSIFGSVIFYLVTNLVLLYPVSMYDRSWQGQVSSYINALPFFRNTILGDLFYTAVFVGSMELIKYFYSRRALHAQNN